MSATSTPTTNDVFHATATHHAQLRAGLVDRTDVLLSAVAGFRDHRAAQEALVDYLRTDLLPHVRVEEGLLYTGTATAQIALLVRAMENEHRMIEAVIEQLSQATGAVEAVALASSLVVLCDVRIEQEEKLLLPALDAFGLDLGMVLGDQPDVVGALAREGVR